MLRHLQYRISTLDRPIPLTPDRRLTSIPAVDYRNFQFVETTNKNLLFVATESDFLNATLSWTNFFGIYGIISAPQSYQYPVILNVPVFTSLQNYANQSSTLSWMGWDDDPANYTLYCNNTIIATGSWQTDVPITYSANTSLFDLSFNYTLTLTDVQGYLATDMWGIQPLPDQPVPFPSLGPSPPNTTIFPPCLWIDYAVIVIVLVGVVSCSIFVYRRRTK